MLTRITHANIVPLLGASTVGAPSPCLVYALMEGGSLEDRLACASGRKPLTSNERVLIISDVARGLAFLHTEHRVIQ